MSNMTYKDKKRKAGQLVIRIAETARRRTVLDRLVLASGVSDGENRGANLPPGKLYVKTGPHLAYISVLVFFCFSLGCCFISFFEEFPGDLEF